MRDIFNYSIIEEYNLSYWPKKRGEKRNVHRQNKYRVGIIIITWADIWLTNGRVNWVFLDIPVHIMTSLLITDASNFKRVNTQFDRLVMCPVKWGTQTMLLLSLLTFFFFFFFFLFCSFPCGSIQEIGMVSQALIQPVHMLFFIKMLR